jgi:hypothetical protein
VPERPPGGFLLAAAFTGSLLVVTTVHALMLSAGWGLALVAAVVTACGIDATWVEAAGAGLLGWLFLTGFVTNQEGELRIDGSTDVWRLLLLVGLALVSSATGAAIRWRLDNTGVPQLPAAGLPGAAVAQASVPEPTSARGRRDWAGTGDRLGDGPTPVRYR